jgi:hypothetical protein
LGDYLNIKRGLFRVWLVMTIVWIALVMVLSWDQIARDKAWIGVGPWENDRLSYLPVRCEDARGAATTDYERREPQEPWNQYRDIKQACFYDQERYRQLWPEYADLDHKALEESLYERLGWETQIVEDPLSRTKTAATVAFGPPMLILVFGTAILWAFAGFRRPEKPLS